MILILGDEQQVFSIKYRGLPPLYFEYSTARMHLKPPYIFSVQHEQNAAQTLFIFSAARTERGSHGRRLRAD